MDLADRIQLSISYAIRLSLLVAIAVQIFTTQWESSFATTIILILTFLPAIIERNYKVYLPIEFELTIIFFTFATLYLGEIHSFYLKFWWWDSFLHGTSGVALGFVGFLIVYILSYEEKFKIRLGPKFVALFSFTFAMAIGAVWEIFEFSMDQKFGMNMQKSGNTDTMWDLIINAGGAFITAFFGYLYLVRKRSDSFIFDRLLRKFMEKNPKMFRKRKS